MAALLSGCGGALPSRMAEAPKPHQITALESLRVVEGRAIPDTFFRHYGVNPTVEAAEQPVSTFSVDTDTAAYTLARGYLEQGHLPEPAAVRVEEFVNRFDYGDAPPEEGPFAVYAEAFPSPNRRGFHVLRVALKGKQISVLERAPANLVFVIDISGSMKTGGRLGLVKRALGLLVEQLDANDRVAIAVYGSTARALLPSTPASEREAILGAIEALQPEGSTNAQAGLELGYALAREGLHPEGINRVILCSDGVANAGLTDPEGLSRSLRPHVEAGIPLTTIGFGMGNYNDVLMEQLAQRADGQYFYVDRLAQARRVFVEQLTGTLQTIARDVKVQLAFDPARVERYRLLGYENRRLEARDFADDRVDAGEIGAGHSVSALYEVKLAEGTGPFATLRLRYKAPQGGPSELVEVPLSGELVRADYQSASGGARLALIAAAFAEKLRGAYWVRNLPWSAVLAQHSTLDARLRAREEVRELRSLIEKAARLDRRGDPFEGEVPVVQMDFDHVPVVAGP